MKYNYYILLHTSLIGGRFQVPLRAVEDMGSMLYTSSMAPAQ